MRNEPLTPSPRVKMVFVAFLCLLLVACDKTNYRSSLEKKIRNEGKDIISEYVKTLIGEDTSRNVQMVQGYVYKTDLHEGESIYDQGGMPTTIVRGEFTDNGNEYVVYVNTANKDIYTNYFNEIVGLSINEIIDKEFLKGTVYEGRDTFVSDIICSNMVICPNMEVKSGKQDTFVEFYDDVVPVTLSEDVGTYALNCIMSGRAKVSLTISMVGDGMELKPSELGKLFAKVDGFQLIDINIYSQSDFDKVTKGEHLREYAEMLKNGAYHLNISGANNYSFVKYSTLQAGEFYINTPEMFYSEVLGTITDEKGNNTEGFIIEQISASSSFEYDHDDEQSYLFKNDHPDLSNKAFLYMKKVKKFKDLDIYSSFNLDPDATKDKYTPVEMEDGYYTLSIGTDNNLLSFSTDLRIQLIERKY